MSKQVKLATLKPGSFADNLSVVELSNIANELATHRIYHPLTKREDGKYEGDILGFVKGLRLSARIIYFLRGLLSETDLDVSWGHMLTPDGQSCSPECDVIVHRKGWVKKWNGDRGNVMEFVFVRAAAVKLVISCKSQVRAIEKDYPSTLSQYTDAKVLLVGECCAPGSKDTLVKAAGECGYEHTLFLYCSKSEDEYVENDEDYLPFAQVVKALVGA